MNDIYGRDATPVTLSLDNDNKRAPIRSITAIADHSPIQVDDSAVASDVTDLVSGCVEALFTLLETFGYDSSTITAAKSKSSTNFHWQRQVAALGGDWMKYAKWKTAAFFHAHTEQLDDAPPRPTGISNENPRHLLCGSAGRYLLSLVRDPLTNRSIIDSVLKAKKGMTRPGEVEMSAQAVKTFAVLTTPREWPSQSLLAGDDLVLSNRQWGDIEDEAVSANIPSVLNRNNCEQQLRRTVFELFEQSDYSLYCDSKKGYHMASISSAYGRSRRKGGAYAKIQERIRRYKLGTWTGRKPVGPSLVKFIELKETLEVDRVTPNLGQEGKYGETEESRDGKYVRARTYTYSKYTGMEEESRQQGRSIFKQKYVADTTALEVNFDQLYNKLLEDIDTVENKVSIVPLSEALKVRIITKGPAERSFLLQPLQRFLWDTVHKNPSMKLIGEPVDIWNIQQRLGAKLDDDEAYLSGDYSAATDNLAPWVSQCIAHAICDASDIDDNIRQLFVDALTGHMIDDPCGGASKQQTWGQLMGSIVSFPVLCIANAALCRWALELSKNKRMQLSQTTLMINGDDCVMRCNKQGLQYWKKITNFAGLTPSLGKYFYTRQFAQINSVNFYRDEPIELLDPSCGKIREMHFTKTAFVNLGLLFGLGRSGELVEPGMEKSDDGLGLASRCHDLIKSSPGSIRHLVMQKFIDLNTLKLKKTYGNIPWFLPESWGGVGLPIFGAPIGVDDYVKDYTTKHYPLPRGFHRNWTPSKVDLRLAHRILKHEILMKHIPSAELWHIRRQSQQRIPQKGFVGTSVEDQTLTDQLFSALAVDTMFSNYFDNEQAQTEAFGAFVIPAPQKAIMSNQKKWRQLMTMPMYSPLSLRKIQQIIPNKLQFPIPIAFKNRELSHYSYVNIDIAIQRRNEAAERDNFIAYDDALWD